MEKSSYGCSRDVVDSTTVRRPRHQNTSNLADLSRRRQQNVINSEAVSSFR